MKGAIGAMLIAAKALASSKVKLKGSLVIAGTVDEEVNSAGTRLLAAKNFKADYAVVGEPTQLKICIAHKGDVTYEITTQGKAAHSSMPEKGISAITKMTKVIAAIENYGTDLKKKRHKLLGHPTVSVGTIQGGVTTWAVPDFCKITVDRRTLPGENADSVQKELQGILNELKQNDSEFAASMKLMTDMGSMEVTEDDQIVRTFREAAATISRTDRGIHFAPYTCNATFFVNQMNTPTVIYGPGDIAQAHKPDEFVSIDECVEAARVYATASVKLLS
jgi:acetylornithine deacetylase/succinyl-diaminopimelate desuccinylase-like protein